ncbi:MAG: formylglycine-generating enzyme family protein [Rhodomicrobium sp.]|nr:formylglycine-generating enzyme family protein [Rhodomicrobium sp.]
MAGKIFVNYQEKPVAAFWKGIAAVAIGVAASLQVSRAETQERKAQEDRYRAEGRILVDAAIADNPQGQWFLPGAGRTESFKDCAQCPEMVVVPSGRFAMGSPKDEPAVGRFSVTFAEWDACAADGGCGGYKPIDQGWGREDHPVINVNWSDARAYVKWLSRKTGKRYRLLSEAEREYVTRAGTKTPFWWGSSISPDQANYNGTADVYKGGGRKGEFRGKTVPVKSFGLNPWGLYQVHGNIWEWVEDCWHDSYRGARGDGSARITGDCNLRALRGGSWNGRPSHLRSAYRNMFDAGDRGITGGFRVARTLNPPPNDTRRLG